ncbi:MAG: alpha/beta hydrolase [Rhodoferax sp.]|nr:alpha/beta hydrolase [Rhodoferax sp.]
MLRRFFVAAMAAVLLGFTTACSQEELAQSALRLEQKIARLERKTVQVGDHSMVYLEGGQGPTVVMLHGITADSGNWTRFARYYTDNYHVVIPDLPGFGDSSRIPTASYSIPAQSERLYALMQTLGVKQFHLVGNSMGGYISAYYAAQHPETVRTLGLFSAAGVDAPTQSIFMKELQAGNNLMLPSDREDFRRVFKLVMEDPPYVPGFVFDVIADKALRNREFDRKVFTELQQQQLDLVPHLPKITAPTLLLWGERDQVLDSSAIPVFQRHLTASKTTVSVIPQVGHLPMLEQPGETAKRHLMFLGN